MTSPTVKPVQSRREKKAFSKLPWAIYQGDPYWVPPLLMQQKELLNFRQHPFYEDAEIQTFLAWRDGQPCGRIAAIVNHVHNRTRPEDQRGFVGFFESIDDVAVSNALFDAARSWLAERGQTALRGPTNPSINYEWGLLVDAFDMSPTFMMTYNPEYYPRLWEEYGFVKAHDLYSFYGHRDRLELLGEKVFFIVEEAKKRFNLKLRPVDKKRFDADVREFLNIYNKALVGTWGFIPLSESEIKHMSSSLRYLIVPELTLIGEIDGRAVGSIFGLLDYNERIKEMNGRLLPFGFLKLLRNRRKIKRLRLISTNVIPEYQRWGVGIVLATELIPPALAWGIDVGEFSWILESNHLSKQTCERANLVIEKTHRVYDLLP